MDLISPHSPVLPDPVPVNKPRTAMASNLPSRGQAGLFPAPLYMAISLRRAAPGLLDDVLFSLDAMASSSPTRRRHARDAFAEALHEDPETSYRLWTIKYPSALSAFEQIAEKAQGKRVALFLDYDGTLSPIVDDPDRAFMSDSMRAAVHDASKHVPIAIISGRSRDKVYEFVGLGNLYYAGSHGMDIVGPVRDSSHSDDHSNCIRSTDDQGKEVSLFQPAGEFIPMIEEVSESLIVGTSDIDGAKVENNKFCVSVHYRNVDEENWPVVAQRVHDTLERYPRLRLTHGRKVLEIRPVIEWNKGKAVEFLLESLGLDSSDDVLPIYIGDDRTDEDAFEVLRRRGMGILVSSQPKESKASFSLRDPSEVEEFLKLLVSWKSRSPTA